MGRDRKKTYCRGSGDRLDLLFKKMKSLCRHQGVQKYFFNTWWLLAEKIVRLVAGLIVGVWVARYLGPERFGILSYGQSLVGLFAALGTLGLSNIVVRELVSSKQEGAELLGTAFILQLVGSICVVVLSAAALFVTPSGERVVYIVYVLAFSTVFQSFSVLDYYFQSKIQSRYVVFSKIVSLLVISALKIILVILEAPLVAFAWVIFLESVFFAVLIIFFYVSKTTEFKIASFAFNLSTARNLLKDSWPLILSGMLVSLYMRIDQVMISAILGNEAVGQYAAAVRISEAWYFVPMVICSSLFPSIVRSKSSDQDVYLFRVQSLYDLMTSLSVLILIPATFFSQYITYSLYGEEYVHAGNILAIHMWSGLFVFLGVASSKWLMAEGLQKYSAINTAIGAVVNILANFILIRKMGVVGAAWATLISQCAAAYLCFFFWDKTRQNFIRMSLSFVFIRHLRVLKSF